MKKIIYICDVCKKDAESEIPEKEEYEVKGKLSLNSKTITISVKIDVEDAEHVCKSCKRKVLNSFLKKEIVDKYY